MQCRLECRPASRLPWTRSFTTARAGRGGRGGRVGVEEGELSNILRHATPRLDTIQRPKPFVFMPLKLADVDPASV